MTTLTRYLGAIIVAFFATLIVISYVPEPTARERAEAYFTAQEIDVGQQYSFERRSFSWAWTAVEMTLLCVLALTGVSRRWADRMLVWTGQRRVLAAVLVGVGYLLLRDVLYLPFGIARLYHAQYWGMSNLELGDWLRDHALAFVINLPWELVAIAGVYTLLILLPRSWWLFGGLGGAALATLYVFLMPIAIAPLFNTFTPLDETPWKDQQSRVRALVDRAGVPVSDILVMNASRQSNHTNAYFSGFGSSRQIVLYDTLLKNHTPDEIESVLAHELGHWQHDHIVKGLVLGTLATLLGLVLLDQVLAWCCQRAPWFLQSKADPAGLPLILLLMSVGQWIAMPVGNVVSRYFEREADQAALDLGQQPKAFIECEKKMARDNKGNVAPSPWNVWLFATHPPVVERIRMAEDWQRERTVK